MWYTVPNPQSDNERLMHMDTMVIIWLSVMVFFILLEAVTTQLVGIWFAVASMVTLVFALFGVPQWAQFVIFVVCTVLMLIITRPLVKRAMKGVKTRTNADRTIGMTALVIQEINNKKAEGQVQVSGQIWTARSLGGNAIPEGAEVTVHSIEGVKLIVEG